MRRVRRRAGPGRNARLEPAADPMAIWMRRVWQAFAQLPGRQPVGVLLRRLGQGGEGHRARQVLERLLRQGWIEASSDGRLGIRQVEGRLEVNPRGFGFVVETGGPDVFVPPRSFGGAVHGDRVRVWVRSDPGAPGPEGHVMDVVERGRRSWIGRLVRAGRSWLVEPRDERLPVVRVGRSRGRRRVPAGTLVRVEIVEWPETPRSPASGRVVEVLGPEDLPGMDMRLLMEEQGLPTAFPEPVLEEAAALPDAVRPEDLAGREDLRDQFIVTIDGADAKDLDDAVSVERTAEGYVVGVHIADVSYYVREGSALDREARTRGTSIYLVDRVIPMFPVALSNQLCSLNPEQDRLTVSVFVSVAKDGSVRGARFARTVIRSRHRLTYEAVNAALAGQAGPLTGLRDWLLLAHEVAELLHQRRRQRGAIDFDLPEPRVELDPSGVPVALGVRERGPAERLIEEFMLLANEAVARRLEERELPGIWRIHEPPAPDKLEAFREMAQSLGYRLPAARPSPKSLQHLLDQAAGKPEERVLRTSLLRAMQQARYAAENVGHFGLATASYTHFTSPIRRYPDLFVHRVLVAHLTGGILPDQAARWAAEAPAVAALASERERLAQDAERASVQLKQVQYMADKLGEEFDAVISGVAAFGLFVQLDTLVEGLVRLEDMPDDVYELEAARYTLVGRRTGTHYRIGDPVRVSVVRVDTEARRIDFRLLGHQPHVRRRSLAESSQKNASRRPRRGRRRQARRAVARTGEA
jgi:ribonuclease R